MTSTQSFLAHWYFHVPNLLMAAMIYALVGRFGLELVLRRWPGAAILAVFRKITSPAFRPIRGLTPRIVPDVLVSVLAICWLTAGRMLWFLACVAAGMRANAGG